MTPPHELAPVVVEGYLQTGVTPEGVKHQHAWLFASFLPHQRQHVVTGQPVQMLSVLFTCVCGGQMHRWMAPPPDLQADTVRAVAGGDLSSLAGKPS